MLEWATRLTPRRVLKVLALGVMAVFLMVPAARQPMVDWYVDWRTQRTIDRLEPLLRLTESPVPSMRATSAPAK